MDREIAPRLIDRIEDLPSAEEFAALSELEIMQAVFEGRLPAPPIARTVGFALSEFGVGRTVFEGTPGFRHFNFLGSVHGGWFGVLLDSCMGCAVHTALPAGKGYTTLEYKINVIRAAGLETGPLKAIGEVSHVGRRTAVAEGRMIDADGRLFARGSTTCLVFDL